jgi:serine/threonine-protein kinase
MAGLGQELKLMSIAVQLPALLAGAPATMHVAVRHILGAILPGCPLVVDLVGQALQAATTSTEARIEVGRSNQEPSMRDLLLIQQILNIIADELPAVLRDAAVIPDAADRILDQALSIDPACLRTVQKIDRLASYFDGLEEDHRRRWSEAAIQPDWPDLTLPLLRRVFGIGDFVTDLRAAAIGLPRFGLLLARFRQGLRAVSDGDAALSGDIFLALTRECPSSAAAALALGTALIVQGRRQEASQMIARSAALRPTDAELIAVCRLSEADEPRPGDDAAIKSFAPNALSCPGPAIGLQIIAGPHQGAHFQFDQEGPVIVGRSPTANLPLVKDCYLSRHHFLLEPQPPHCYLRDLGSDNGTRVNGQPVVECYLRHGDIVAVGETRLRFDVFADTQPPTVTQGSLLELETDAGDVQPLEYQEQIYPTIVPGYDIIGTLGEGGMGTVYLARSQARNQEVALKIIRPDLVGHNRSTKRFLREINVLGSLDHPRIVRFHEMGSVEGQFFFAMEYVRTINLKKLLSERTSADRIQICCGIACQVLEGLGYAHGRGFIHRDVKTSNILVSGQDPGLQAHLADFGLAKNFQSTGMSAMTFDREILGTLTYMAPEQVVDSRSAKPSVDIYSLGATLYHLLSDQAPFDLRQHKNPPAAILEDEPISLAHWCPWLPPELGRLVRQAMAKDPAHRFRTALEMRSALLPFATVPLVGARTVSIPARTK